MRCSAPPWTGWHRNCSCSSCGWKWDLWKLYIWSKHANFLRTGLQTLHHYSHIDPLQRDLAFREELMPSSVCPISCVPLQSKQDSRHETQQKVCWPVHGNATQWEVEFLVLSHPETEFVRTVKIKHTVSPTPPTHKLLKCLFSLFRSEKLNVCVVIIAEKQSPYVNIIFPTAP